MFCMWWWLLLNMFTDKHNLCPHLLLLYLSSSETEHFKQRVSRTKWEKEKKKKKSEGSQREEEEVKEKVF